MHPDFERKRAWFASWPWAVVFFAAVVGLGALNYYLLVPVKQATIDAQIVQLRHIAQITEASVTTLLGHVKGVLREIREYQENEALAEELDEYLRVEGESTEAIKGMVVRDGAGRVTKSSMPGVAELEDGARAFFAAHRYEPDPIYFSSPIRSPVNGQWLVWMSLAKLGASGEVDLIISAALDPRYIAVQLMPTADSSDDANTLVDRSFHIVARNPWVTDTIGASVEDYPLYQNLDGTRVTSTAADYYSPFTESERLGVAKWIFNRQFVISVSRPLEAVLVGWERSVMIAGVGSFAVLLLVGLMWWITARKAAREHLVNEVLRDSERRFRLLINGVTDYAIFMLDTKGCVANWNQGAERITGYYADEIVGEPVSQFYSDADRDMQQPERDLEQTKVWGRHESEGWLLRKNGTRFWANTILQAIRGEGRELLGFAMITRDTTERKKMMNELRSAKAKAERVAAVRSDFLANMSHEIRTPLTGIMGYSRLALEYGHMSNIVRSYVERVFEASRALRGIIGDILDFSKLESGEISLDAVPFSVREFVEGCVAIVRLMAEEKGIELKAKIDDSVPKWVSGDASRLRQVLLNLLNNAIKFTPNGRVEVRLDCVSISDQDANLRVLVIDTGIGISDEDQKKLFVRFSQADASIARKYGGTGLGLAISKRIVEAMGGEICLESKRGVGSTFSFVVTVPIAEAPEQEKRKIALRPEQWLDVLMVDDLDMNRDLVKLVLEHAGHRVTLARDGAEAIEKARGNRFDMILMDIQMPGVGGIEAARRIRKLGPGYGDLPIVALTADAMPDRVEQYMKAGFTDHLAKPIDTDRLLDFMEDWAAKIGVAEQAASHIQDQAVV